MTPVIRTNRLVIALAAAFLFAATQTVNAQTVELRKGDHICLIGNALGVRTRGASRTRWPPK